MIQLNDWTACSETLPKKDGRYLVTYVKGYVDVLDFALDLNAFDKWDFPENMGYKNKPGFIEDDSEYGYYDITKEVVAWTEAPEGWEGDSK